MRRVLGDREIVVLPSTKHGPSTRMHGVVKVLCKSQTQSIKLPSIGADSLPMTASSDLNRVYLISCVSKKLAQPAPAAELYQSALFQKSRAFVDSRLSAQDRWFILSAKYHLVRPSDVIAPYEVTLNRMRAGERQLWAATVLAQLEPELAQVNEVIFLAGKKYRESLEGAILNGGCSVSVPMAKLGIGYQLQWLSQSLTEVA